MHDPHLQIPEGILYRNSTGSVGYNHNTDHLPALFHRRIFWSAAGQPASAHTPGASSHGCKSDALLQRSCACHSPECEHHRAPIARKRCGPCRNHPESADHIKRAGRRQADNGGCSGGQWGGGCGGSGISEVEAAGSYTRGTHACAQARCHQA